MTATLVAALLAVVVVSEPGRPEAPVAALPREMYRDDCEVTLDIGRVAGEYATMAGLTLYERYPYRRGGEGGIQATAIQPGLQGAAGISSVSPSPFRSRARISYSLVREGSADVYAYDIQGRLVRHLVSGQHGPGRYDAVWDGRDDSGRRLPAGTYYLRLELPDASSSRVVVLTR